MKLTLENFSSHLKGRLAPVYLVSGDEALLAYWCGYIEEASGLAHLTALCRVAEARIRAERQAERERAAA